MMSSLQFGRHLDKVTTRIKFKMIFVTGITRIIMRSLTIVESKFVHK